jgi:hypothetical protein
MTRKKIVKRELLLCYKVGVRFDQKTYSILKELVQKTNCHSVGELVRRIIVKNKIRFYSIDSTMDVPINEIIRIKEELNAIGRNINQITHEFHTADTATQKLFLALKVNEKYQQATNKINPLFAIISELGGKWLSPERLKKTRIEIRLENFEFRSKDEINSSDGDK